MRAVLYSCFRNALFAAPPEVAHAAVLRALSLRAKMQSEVHPLRRGEVCAMGLRFDNPLGLAAGMDKDGICIDGFGALGFGFIEVGAVTPLAQDGNPRPRVFRLQDALINRMGFNNCGAAQMKINMTARKYRGIVGINLGKNAKTPPGQAADDYVKSMRELYECGDFFTINISSPNTARLRKLQQAEELQKMLPKITDARDELAKKHNRRAPLAIKISPDLDEDEIAAIAEVAAAMAMDGIIATNTTTSRPANVREMRYANEQGGLSGKPLRDISTAVIKQLRKLLPRQIAIIGVGGIFDADDAAEKLQAGAQLIQLYTALIYRGPSLPQKIINTLPTNQ
ncbi:MAG: dihydroorotate dehydrogenase (quinone) [Gammaproteobacteria bacterium]